MVSGPARRSSKGRATAVSEAFHTTRAPRKSSSKNGSTRKTGMPAPSPSRRSSASSSDSTTSVDPVVSVAVRRHVLSTARAYLAQKREQRGQEQMKTIAMHCTYMASRRTSKAGRFIRNLRENAAEQKLLRPSLSAAVSGDMDDHEFEVETAAASDRMLDEVSQLAAQLDKLSCTRSANEAIVNISESISACTDLLSRLHATGLAQALHLDRIAEDLQNAQDGYGVSKALLQELQEDIARMRKAMESMQIEQGGDVAGIRARQSSEKPETGAEGIAPVLQSLEQKTTSLLTGADDVPTFDELDDDATRLLEEVERATSSREPSTRVLVEIDPDNQEEEQLSCSESDAPNALLEQVETKASTMEINLEGEGVKELRRSLRPSPTPFDEGPEDAETPDVLAASPEPDHDSADMAEAMSAPAPDPLEPSGTGSALEMPTDEDVLPVPPCQSNRSSHSSTSSVPRSSGSGPLPRLLPEFEASSSDSSPANSVDRAVHEFWRDFCVESDLPPGFLADAASPSCTAADLKGVVALSG
ncbi:unnamed protein product [Symbiodinium sp. CCMP2592]|nr:unnamed protein product [Symbiodinium sp. CCMP2592]